MSTMAYLPQDLLLDVLSRLPVKSLLRFKCVSPSWLSLIINPEFVDFHLHRSKTSINGFRQTDRFTVFMPLVEKWFFPFFIALDIDQRSSCKAVEINLHGLPEEGLSVIGACNGLICLLVHKFPNSVAFWNPSTRKYRQRPVITYPDIARGFGYDPKNKDFKLLIVTDRSSAGTWYKIYSLKSDSWGPKRKLRGIDLLSGGDTFYNGALHFIGVLGERDYSGQEWVVAFDLATEEWRPILALPDGHPWPWSACLFSALGDSLYAICDGMEVWVMKSEGTPKSWKMLSNLTGKLLIYAEGDRKVLVYGPGLNWCDFEMRGLQWCDVDKGGAVVDFVHITPQERSYDNCMLTGIPFTYCQSLVSV